MKLGARDGRGRPAKFPVIKQHIRSALIQGHYKSGQQLPAVEAIARQFSVGGPTVKRAVDELAREGWLESRHGVGTFVSMRHSRPQVMLTAPRKQGWETVLSVENLDAFREQHPNVQVTLSSEPTTDILVTDSYSLIVDRIRGQTLQSLDDLQSRFGKEPWQLPDRMRALGTYNGALFGLPLRADLMVLQANPRSLENIDVTPPDRYLNWDQRKDILTRCRQDRDGDGVVECFGAYSKLASYEWLIPFWQRGGRLDDRDAFFGAEAIQVLNELWEMHHKSVTLPIEMTHGKSETANEIIRQRFISQQIAMRWITSVAIFKPLPFPTTILLPQFGPVRRQEMHASVLGIHSDCAHPDVAIKFLDFCYRRFIRDNHEYPFALAEEHRHFLRQTPAVHRLLQEGFADASEPLHEGSPLRTWAIEREIYNGLRLLQSRERMLTRLQQHWDQWNTGLHPAGVQPSSLILPGAELLSPVDQLPAGS